MLLFVFDRSVFRTCFILLCTYFFCCSIVKVQFLTLAVRELVYYITSLRLCQYLFLNFFKKFFDSGLRCLLRFGANFVIIPHLDSLVNRFFKSFFDFFKIFFRLKVNFRFPLFATALLFYHFLCNLSSTFLKVF